MKVLLIFPPKNTIALAKVDFFKNVDFESGSYPALGLLYIAAYAKKHTKDEIEIIDAPSENLGYPQLEERIRAAAPDVAGIYFNTEYLIDSLKTAELLKKVRRDTVVVAGGPHVMMFPKETILKKDVDYCVYGEGEIAFSNLLIALSLGTEPEKIEGVISKKNVDFAHRLQKIDDLDSLPIPERTMLDYKKYASVITYSNPVTTIMTSRGCAFNCYYCNNIERAQKVRMRSAGNVVEEIKAISKLGIKDIIFFDENFTFDMNRVNDICDLILENKLNVRWHCRSRADMKLDAQALNKMRLAGCRMIQFGIETASERLQELINKRIDLKKVEQLIKKVKAAGILAYGNFIIGLPTETKEEMDNTLDFALKSGLDYAPFSNFHPIPKSVFYENGLKSGQIKTDYWLEFAKDPSNRITQDWWPGQDIEHLNKFNMYAFRKFYLRPVFVFKSLLLKESLKQKLWKIKSAIKLFVLPKNEK